MQSSVPITRELLLVGGGHTHALVLRMWGMKPLPGVRVTVINPHATAPYSGMLPGFVAGHYRRDELDIDLVQLARFAGARLVAGRAAHIDRLARRVVMEDGRELGYDLASVDIGITSAMDDLPGFAEHAIPAKPLDRFAAEWTAFRAQAATRKAPARAMVIGGGVAGVELAMAMAFALEGRAQVTLVDRDEILPGMQPSRLAFFRKALAEAGVTVVENDAPSEVLANRVVLASGRVIETEFIVGAAGARAQDWLRESALALNAGGFIEVDAELRSLNTPEVFAVGDCAHLTHAPRPKAGVFAVREAPVLYENLRAVLSGDRLRAFRPQKDYLKLISLGGKLALADKWGLMWHGPKLWRLKDRIDRKFMDQFRTLEPMRPERPKGPVALGVDEVLGTAPLCGGCGAKVSGTALAGVMATLPARSRDDVLSGPGDDAAMLKGPDGATQVISTDHLRAFCEDPALMARIAAVHALGDVWAMGAEAQAALASVTLPRLSGALQGAWLDEIMQAAAEVFADAGATVVGGHSSQGAELSIGFTVTGLCKGAPIGKDGARAGDALILTKPIGTGTILAGEMALKAHGDDVLAAYDSMAKSQREAARILGGARAMTDVTGFGLAGHAQEMVRASGVGIRLRLADIPVLAGAEALAEAGVRSSLFADNRALVAGLAVPEGGRGALLFDPQTAGGLLAAVAAGSAGKLVDALRAQGFDAAVIGECTDQDGRLEVL